MDFNEELRSRVARINSILASYLPGETGLQKTVLEAMNYSVNVGGKRLRPMLMQETYRLFGGCDPIVEPFMAALEMIHTYSLVHDDLPAMDNDEYRRGQKTTHAVYGETMGILAGDALLNYAFEVASDAVVSMPTPETAKAMQILAQKAGVYGMIGGQVVDIESENKETDLDTVTFIHKNKTAALIESAMLIGAVLAGATSQQQQKVEQIATDVGVAFQIRDDILDVTSSTEVLGKPVGSDEKNRKATYVSLRGLDQARQDVAFLSQRALDTLAALEGRNPFLEELIKMLISREK
jgi:geranylgeranyl diphosphate synthase type II